MPTYEYACLSCGTHVEVYQRFSEEPLTVCGVCGGPLRKVFHPAGILFKGSGFYATDSRASRTRERAGSDGSDGEKGGDGEKGATAASEKAGSTTGSGSRNGSDSKGGTGSRSGSGSTGETSSGTGSTSRRESSKKREPKGEGSTKERSA